jgi:hypothetical protein
MKVGGQEGGGDERGVNKERKRDGLMEEKEKVLGWIKEVLRTVYTYGVKGLHTRRKREESRRKGDI